MLQYDFENSVGYWIFATAHDLACTINEEFAGMGITHRQWEVLAWISYLGELSQTELAEKMGIEVPTLVGVLDRMERDGWIQRIPSETDRRKKLIRVTEKSSRSGCKWWSGGCRFGPALSKESPNSNCKTCGKRWPSCGRISACPCRRPKPP